MRSWFAAILACLAEGVAADPIEGLWRIGPDGDGKTGLIEMAACGEAFCGTLLRAYHASGEGIASGGVGREVVWDAVALGGGRYRGRVYAVDRDQDYAAHLALDGDRLVVWGCVLGLCRPAATWHRVE